MDLARDLPPVGVDEEDSPITPQAALEGYAMARDILDSFKDRHRQVLVDLAGHEHRVALAEAALKEAVRAAGLRKMDSERYLIRVTPRTKVWYDPGLLLKVYPDLPDYLLTTVVDKDGLERAVKEGDVPEHAAAAARHTDSLTPSVSIKEKDQF